MSDSIYSFRAGPTYRGATREESLTAALDQPMSLASTFFDQAKGGVLESFGLGTVLRDLTTPEGRPEEKAPEDDRFGVKDALDLVSPHPVFRTYDFAKGIAQSLINDEDSPALSEDAYKSSAYFREGVPWDAAMTEQRAEALAESFDAKKVREFYSSKRPITSFIANLAGQATDPINYIPIAGPAVRTAAVAKMGKVAGASVTAALDAAANTAIFGIGTASQRARYGDDVSWQTTVSQIATAALIGSAFGAIGGALGRRGDAASRSAIEERLATLKTTQEARIALNEGIDALVRGEDVRLTPNATEPLTRVQREIIAYHGSRSDFERFDITKVGSGEGGSLQGRGLYFNDAKPVGEYYRDQLGGSNGVLYEAAISGKKEDFLDWRKPLSGQGESVREQISKLMDLGPVKPEFVYTDRNGGALFFRKGTGVNKFGKVAKSGDSFVVSAKGEPFATVASLDEAEAALRLKMQEVGIEWRGDERTGEDVFEMLGGRGKAEGVLREAGIPGVVAEANYKSGRSNDYVVFDDGRISIRAKNGQPIDTSSARPDAPPEGIDQAAKAIAKPDDYKALAAQYRVDPETGSFSEEADIAQLGVEGRLTDDDVATLADAQATFEDGAAFGEALKSVAGCLI